MMIDKELADIIIRYGCLFLLLYTFKVALTSHIRRIKRYIKKIIKNYCKYEIIFRIIGGL